MGHFFVSYGMKKYIYLSTLFVATSFCVGKSNAQDKKPAYKEATFAMGCFWHTEEICLELKGVIDAKPGYAGGTEKNPNYEMVSTGETRYAESVNIKYDPSVISYDQLLEVFFASHDPTTPNRSGNDVGPQYRSIVFYRNDEQKKEATDHIAKLKKSHKYRNEIVTEIVPFTSFHQAENYHIHYYRLHPDEGYVVGVVKPEVEEFRKEFKAWLK
jgi:peptide-methionine (S)-S-oxide reductase